MVKICDNLINVIWTFKTALMTARPAISTIVIANIVDHPAYFQYLVWLVGNNLDYFVHSVFRKKKDPEVLIVTCINYAIADFITANCSTMASDKEADELLRTYTVHEPSAGVTANP